MAINPVFDIGKLPAPFLASLLGRYQIDDPRVIVRPSVGVDAAVIDTGGDELLVVKSDPITFATDQIGWYAVHVNANDIACMGATPHWFLATALLPPLTAASTIERIFEQLQGACQSLGVSVVGGHTEVTHGLDRPIISGMMLGTVARERLVTPQRARAGDQVIVARGFPIEGTALIAHERASELVQRGWSEEDVGEAQRFLHDPGISVVRAARIAGDTVSVRAMHDPTEGGLATGLREMAHAAGLGLRVRADALPLLPLAARLCREFGLDPLGTIASGALCLAVAPGETPALLEAFAASAIPATVVGELLEPGAGEWLVTDQGELPFPSFDVDEITRLF